MLGKRQCKKTIYIVNSSLTFSINFCNSTRITKINDENNKFPL